MSALDRYDERWGRGTVVLAAAGFAKTRTWSTKCELRSPRYRTEYPDRLDGWRRRRSMLLGTDSERAAALRGVQHLTTARHWLDCHLEKVAAEHAAMMRHDPMLLVQAIDAAVLGRSDATGLLGEIAMPVDVLSGGLDQATPATLGAEIAAGVADGRHLVVPDAAHHIPREAPETVTRVVLGRP